MAPDILHIIIIYKYYTIINDNDFLLNLTFDIG